MSCFANGVEDIFGGHCGGDAFVFGSVMCFQLC
jgi:hypothetical protein